MFATGDGGCGGIGNGFGGGGGTFRKVTYSRPENACVKEITQTTVRWDRVLSDPPTLSTHIKNTKKNMKLDGREILHIPVYNILHTVTQGMIGLV